MMSSIQDAMNQAIGLRNSGKVEEARIQLLALQASNPEDAVLNLQVAWTHDKLGLESEAVPFYESALAGDLDETDALDAFLGLGSTLRALGRYEEAVAALDEAVERFPKDTALQVFRAMALYNSGRAKEACERLLLLLIDTTGDDRIKAYRAALEEYAANLDRTW